MIVIDSEVGDSSMFSALDILYLSRESYLIVILCRKKSQICLRSIKSFVNSADNIIVVDFI